MAGSEVFIDTAFWIAAARQRDLQHERAKVLGRQLLERRAKFVISNMVLAEVVTFIAKKDGYDTAEQLMKLLEDNTTVLFVDRPVFEAAKPVLRKYWSSRKRLSICDATSYVLMRNRRIQDLYSFDSGFDGLPGITRIA